THEHLAILRLLEIPRGVVAVTKADAVEPEQVELAVAEAAELVPEAEVVAVSAKTGAGLDELRAALARAAEAVERPERFAATRLWIDRAFSLRGIGTVVTGTLWSGSIAAGDLLRLEPERLEILERGDPAEIVSLLIPEPVTTTALQAMGLCTPAQLAKGLAAVNLAGEWAYRPTWLEGVRAIVRERLAERAGKN